jgi:hypothetical protein
MLSPVPGDFTLDQLVRALGDPQATNVSFTAASQLLNLNGRQLSQRMFDIWRSLSVRPPQSRVRETNAGLMMGARHYSNPTRLQDTRNTQRFDAGTMLLMSTVADRTPWFDDRRLPDLAVSGADPDTAHVAMQDRFVTTLRTPDGPVGFGATWASDGDSFGLVIYVSNCDIYGGLGAEGYVGLSVGGTMFCQQKASAIAGLFDVEPVARPLSDDWKRAGVERPTGALVAPIAHELGHTSPVGDLLDEYGSDPPHIGPDAADIAHVEAHANVQALADAQTGTRIDPEKLKWNWPRIAAAADIEMLTAQGEQLVITVNTDDIIRWPSKTIGRTAFLRARSTTLVDGNLLSDPLVIRAVSVVDQTITVDVSPTELASVLADAFATSSIIYMPRVDASNQVLRLVDPAVISAMSNGPFEKASSACEPATQKGPPATIPGYQFPLDKNTVIAAYETAGQLDCGVIRPAAKCMMQNLATRRRGRNPYARPS